MGHWNRKEYPVEQMRQWIAEGRTQAWIGEQLGIQPKLIYKACKRFGIQCQRTGPRAAEGHPEWKGGKTVHKHGYVRVYAPDHPSCIRVNENRRAKANGGWYRKHRYVWEHRLVMEQHLGRYLLPNEVVHHKNGIRDDNRIENLQLYQSNGEHLKDDLAGRCPKWSEEGRARILAAVRRRKPIRQESEPDADRNSRTPDLTAA